MRGHSVPHLGMSFSSWMSFPHSEQCLFSYGQTSTVGETTLAILYLDSHHSSPSEPLITRSRHQDHHPPLRPYSSAQLCEFLSDDLGSITAPRFLIWGIRVLVLLVIPRLLDQQSVT
ncbi:hypothetical protein HZ326_22297 [Fusarium oxysporum f. sp. albedinis]|nr:hypothetical protein HZ326_22297 [Fusarium oxysporum f. sp. albedinis]